MGFSVSKNAPIEVWEPPPAVPKTWDEMETQDLCTVSAMLQLFNDEFTQRSGMNQAQAQHKNISHG